VTNRASTVKDQGQAANMTAASGFSQMSVAGSNFIDSGTTSGWFSAFGGNGYSSAGASENPFARLNLYNDSTAANYPDLVRAGLNTSKGSLRNGDTSAGTAWTNRIDPTVTNLIAGTSGVGGTTLDSHWMMGRFAIDVTGKSASEVITMNAQFNMVGKNGTAAETGTTFTGATTASYKVSNFFAFAVPAPGAAALLGAAGLLSRRRKA
jgi:hypothetical protein